MTGSLCTIQIYLWKVHNRIILNSLPYTTTYLMQKIAPNRSRATQNITELYREQKRSTVQLQLDTNMFSLFRSIGQQNTLTLHVTIEQTLQSRHVTLDDIFHLSTKQFHDCNLCNLTAKQLFKDHRNSVTCDKYIRIVNYQQINAYINYSNPARWSFFIQHLLYSTKLNL